MKTAGRGLSPALLAAARLTDGCVAPAPTPASPAGVLHLCTTMPPRAHYHQRLLSGSLHPQRPRSVRPAAAYHQRGQDALRSAAFAAPETWHEPLDRTDAKYVVQPAGHGFIHPVTVDEVRTRLAELPTALVEPLEVVQFSQMTRKRKLFPCYGMQWGPNVYLYPMEASLVEVYTRPPKPLQLMEAKMFGGEWSQQGQQWQLTWTEAAIKDFYLNNVLIHELGHVLDTRNTRTDDRERYAIWFATEYGYRASRGRR